jgi:hypothetical protein
MNATSMTVILIVMSMSIAAWALLSGGMYAIFQKVITMLPHRCRSFIAKKSGVRLSREFISPVANIKERVRHGNVDKEIYEAICYVRNIISARKGKGVSAETLLSRLAERKTVLQGAYRRALSLNRLGRSDDLVRMFAEDAGTKSAQDFIRIIVRWDLISPEKLASTLLSYQSSMKEMRTTAIKRKTEVLSDLLFLPVITNVMLIFVNFILIAYFLGQKDLLVRMFL